MEDIKKIKSIINRLNRACDKEGCSLSWLLLKWQLKAADFFKLLGIEESLLTEETNSIISMVLAAADSRISFSPDLESIEHDELELYSPSLNIGISFLKNEIKFNRSLNSEDEESISSDVNFLGLRVSGKDVEKIQFYLKKRIRKEDMRRRMITQKYPLKHMKVGATFFSNGNEDSFEITINEDMFLNDLNYIERLLYGYKFAQAKEILLRYPSDLKIISDSTSLHNFRQM